MADSKVENEFLFELRVDAASDTLAAGSWMLHNFTELSLVFCNIYPQVDASQLRDLIILSRTGKDCDRTHK